MSSPYDKIHEPALFEAFQGGYKAGYTKGLEQGLGSIEGQEQTDFHTGFIEGGVACITALQMPGVILSCMLSGRLPKLSVRSFVKTHGEVINTDEAQLMEIARLRELVESLRDRKNSIVHLQTQLTGAQQMIAVLDNEVGQWKANHADVVARNRILRDRPDLPADRIPAVEQLEVLQNENAQLRLQCGGMQMELDELKTACSKEFESVQLLNNENTVLKDKNAVAGMRIKELDLLFGRYILGMRSAIIEAAHGKGNAVGMAWIWNALAGPGQLPPDDETDAQAYFDREIVAIDEGMQEVLAFHEARGAVMRQYVQRSGKVAP